MKIKERWISYWGENESYKIKIVFENGEERFYEAKRNDFDTGKDLLVYIDNSEDLSKLKVGVIKKKK